MSIVPVYNHPTRAISLEAFMRSLLTVCVVASTLLLGAAANAAGEATQDEAKAMAIKAAEFLKSVGPDQAFPEFDAKDGRWHDRDLYVIVSQNGVVVAHGTNPGLIGKSVIDLRDVDGKQFVREADKITDAGWVTYKWQNPITKVVEPKAQYYVRVGDYRVSVGAFVK
jgi:signal transduction histidine kinase